ncbi:hypothetical protein T439DRAFT_335827 [Meredithblackwellia eburnea MCA 4105]
MSAQPWTGGSTTPATSSFDSYQDTSGMDPAAKAGRKIQLWILGRDPTAIFVLTILFSVWFLYRLLKLFWFCFKKKKRKSNSKGFIKIQDQRGMATEMGALPLDAPGGEGTTTGPSSLSSGKGGGAYDDSPYQHKNTSQETIPPYEQQTPVPVPLTSSPHRDGAGSSLSAAGSSYTDSPYKDPTEHVLKRGPGSFSSKKAQQQGHGHQRSNSGLKPLNLGQQGSATADFLRGDLESGGGGVSVRSVDVGVGKEGREEGNYLGLSGKVSEWSTDLFRRWTVYSKPGQTAAR